jgi:cytidylate kinase
MKIAISGKSGCGNTTVSKVVAERLDCHMVNFTFRNLAQECGRSLSDIIREADTNERWDREVDSRQVALARAETNCVLGSRLAIWMLPEADLKVYLYCDSGTRAKRVWQREGGALDAVAAFTETRDHADRARYLRLYAIDNDEYAKVADIVINAARFSPENIAHIIIAACEKV